LFNLKSTVLSILFALAKDLDGATKIIENVMVITNFAHLLRQNSKESSTLVKKVFEEILYPKLPSLIDS